MKRTLFFVCLAVCAVATLIAIMAAQPASAGQLAGSTQAGGASPTPTQCVQSYACGVTPGATIVSGTIDTGNHGDDVVTFINLPFPVTIYGTTYNGANLSSNGNAQFVSTEAGFENACLPVVGFGPTIFAYWDDLVTVGTNCAGGCGIYTSVSGSAPNRIFNIEWRTFYFSQPGNAYFEIRLYESSTTFEVILGTLNPGATGTIGVQDGQGRFTECLCSTTPPQNSKITFTTVSCGTSTPTVTPGASTNTPANTATATVTTSPSATATAPTATNPPGVTSTATAIPTQTTSPPTPTACAIEFTDVPSGYTFYPYIHCMACRGIISGYSSGCETGNPCFRPGNDVTRGQTAKIVSNSAGFSEPVIEQSFEDVPSGSTFYDFIGRLATRGYINGYPCGGPGEPCGPDNLPYFRPNATVTRGQLSKIVSEAAAFSDVPTGQQFEDVPPGSTFYPYIYRLVVRQILAGYPCGNPEPCVPPSNLPYFRSGNPATRGQTSKIVSNTFFPKCEPPGKR